MKAKQTITQHLPKGFTINPALTGKYANEPFFLEKAERMKQILQKSPFPEQLLRQKK